MFGHGLRQLQATLNRKADVVQREFNSLGEQLQALNQKVSKASAEEREALVAERERVYQKQRDFADEANLWRDRAREVLRQQNDDAVRAYMAELLATQDELVRPAAEHILRLLDAPADELAAMEATQLTAITSETPTGRFIARARTAYDLRTPDPAARREAASEFANRTNMAQNKEAIAELERALNDPDPLVKELVNLTLIQMHRFCALRLGDLDVAHEAVLRLTGLTHPAVIPVLIEVTATPRKGFGRGEAGMVDADNSRSREAALKRLVEWHTPEAHVAVRARQRDRDPQIAQVATQALESFPDAWKGA